MIGAKFLARVASSDTLFGFRLGVAIEDVERALHVPFVEEVKGRRGARIMRRDYGFVELAFENEPDWICRWMAIEVHRFSMSCDLIEEVRASLDVEFNRYTAWSDVRRELDRVTSASAVECAADRKGYKQFRIDGSRAIIQVIDDPGCVRGDFPGDGDVWGVDIW